MTFLVGSRGSDSLDGGNGFDTADYGNLGNLITLRAVGVVDKGSAGTDQILNIERIIGAIGQDNVIDGAVPGGGPVAFNVNLAAQSLTTVGIPGLGNVTFTVENFVDVIGTSNTDTITGSSADNEFGGSAGNDTIDGGSGNDIVNYSDLGQAITLERAGTISKGSAGTDQIFNIETIIGAAGEANAIDGSTGTSGTTSFEVNLANEQLVVNGVPGLGSIEFEVVNFVNVTGTSNDDDITGNSEDNLFGSSVGDDSYDGSSGNDTVDYSDLGRSITLERGGVINKGSAGTDQILSVETVIGAPGQDNKIDGSTGISGQTSFDIDLSQETLTVKNLPGLGNLTLNVVNFVDATGTTRNDSILGNTEDNEVRGGNGNDTLTGGEGDDRLLGEAGRDVLNGVDPTSATPGAGEQDVLVGAGAADTYVLGNGANIFYSFSGNADVALIQGFQTNLDKIQLTGSLTDYFFNAQNTAIFATTNNDLVASFVGGAFNPAVDFTFV
ncbi:MAG: calcium-binding protein [Oscillatoriales cyanobacterium RM1_1_9]|nr:calcium-binding protein [Oscillatoriales cyanobacterium RM1_1_9]